LVVKLELGRLQGVHPAPLSTTNTALGSMPVPVMLNVNDWLSDGGVGEVENAVIWGPVPADTETRKLRWLDAVVPGPFTTVTTNVPAGSTAVPVNWVELALSNPAVSTVHVTDGPHPRPLKYTEALLGSKPVPMRVKKKAWPPSGVAGEVEIAVSIGATPDDPATFNCKPFETGPEEPFCTVTVNRPAASVAAPPTWVEDLFESWPFVTTHADAAHPGPVNVTKTVLGSKPEPVIVKENVCPFRAGFGKVTKLVIWTDPVEPTTTRDWVLEGTPAGPFCTVTV
jgi:hypothetical protein